MSEKIYEHIKEQYKYNSRLSKRYKTLFYSFEILALILTALTTIILTISDIPPIIPGVTSGLAVILKVISSTIGFQKLWINCRIQTENIKSEKRKFENRILEYKGLSLSKAEKQLALNLEFIIQNGNDIWIKIIEDTKEEKS